MKFHTIIPDPEAHPAADPKLKSGQAVLAKFSQNPKLRDLLLSTGSAKLVERTKNVRLFGYQRALIRTNARTRTGVMAGTAQAKIGSAICWCTASPSFSPAVGRAEHYPIRCR